MGKCPECQEEEMKAIGTEKFEVDNAKGRSNWQAEGNKLYLVYVIMYCPKCNVLSYREPKKIFG